VQLQSTDPNALDNWLTANGYAITDELKPIIAAYVQQGFDFLAMKLVPGQGVQAMRPVRVSFNGASPTLPLRMVAAGTGATVGVTLWVVADGRYEPANFPWFRIDDADIVWDWSKSDSNYTTLRQQKEAAANNTAWEVEASLDLGVAQIESQIRSAAQYGVVVGGGGSGGGAPAVTNGDGYEPVPAANGQPAQTADQVMEADIATLFTGIGGTAGGSTFRLTRLRSDLAHAALANDLQLQAATDQSTLTNVRVPGQNANGPLCPVYDGCSIVGYQPLDGNAASGSGTGHEAAGCSTTGSTSTDWNAATALAGLLGMIGLTAARARRRR
jgi:MYXO-CTERM domain-containing protein